LVDTVRGERFCASDFFVLRAGLPRAFAALGRLRTNVFDTLRRFLFFAMSLANGNIASSFAQQRILGSLARFGSPQRFYSQSYAESHGAGRPKAVAGGGLAALYRKFRDLTFKELRCSGAYLQKFLMRGSSCRATHDEAFSNLSMMNVSFR
jgi:hypothetical protein